MRRLLLSNLLLLSILGLGGCHGHLHTGEFNYSARAYLPPCPPAPPRHAVNRHYYGYRDGYACPPPRYGHDRQYYPRGRRH